MATGNESPFKIQLAIQGGGARIIYLLAVLEGIDELGERVHVTRVAGTSAGALAGAIFLYKRDWNSVHTWLESLRQSVLPKFRVNFWKIAWEFGVFSRPFLNEDFLKNSLISFFPNQLELDERLFVVSTNLTKGGERIHKAGDPLVDSIMDSCGLPFVFRCKGKSSVDGGLCNNLPITLLRPNKTENGPILSIGFPFINKPEAKTRLQFLLNLFDASIQSNIQMQKEFADYTFTILTPKKGFVDVIDFEGAIDLLGTDTYQLIKDHAKKVLENVISEARKLNSQPKTSRPVLSERNSMNVQQVTPPDLALVQIMENLHKTHLSSVKKVYHWQNTIYAHSLDQNSGKGDQLETKIRFSPHGAPLMVTRFGIDSHDGSNLEVRLMSDSGEQIPADCLQLAETDNWTTVYIFPREPLLQNEIYTLYFYQTTDCTESLRKNTDDEFVVAPECISGDIDTLEIIYKLPKSFPCTLTFGKNSCAEQRELTRNELNLISMPPGYYGLGAKAIQVSGQFSVAISPGD